MKDIIHFKSAAERLISNCELLRDRMKEVSSY